ncbi:MAG: LuxR C-terminal-related transcriptional regulator [Pseudonocardiaceae bacterium]
MGHSEIIHAEIIRNLETAELVMCDISGLNANVFFELGIRVTLDRPVALVKDTTTTSIPFGNAPVSCYTYDAGITAWSLKVEVEKLAEFITKAGAQDRNAMWKYFGITQRASVPSVGDPVQDKLDLLLTLLERQPDARWYEAPMPFLPPPLNQLTTREHEMLSLLAAGESNVRIARQLSLSEKAVRNRISVIFDKLGVVDRVQAALLARDMGIAY